MYRTLRACLVAAGCLLAAGCGHLSCCLAVKAESADSTRYLVLGLGVIAVPQTQAQQNGIVATRMQALGLVISGQPGLKVGLGYSSSSVVAVPLGLGDATVEASSCTPGGVTVRATTHTPQTID